MTRAPAVALAALLTSSCGATLLELPAGTGTAAADGAEVVAQATSACRAVTTLTAEIAVSGSVNGQRVRATLAAGLAAPASARLEAYAFNQAVFTFVAVGDDGTLRVDRDRQALEHAPPADILEALTGVPLDAAGLLAMLTGCATNPNPAAARQLNGEWRMVPDASGSVYIRRDKRGGEWQIVAARRRDRSGTEWRADYRGHTAGLPRDVRLISADRQRFNLHLELRSLEPNEAIDPESFRLPLSPALDRITLDELRRAGGFGGAAPASNER